MSGEEGREKAKEGRNTRVYVATGAVCGILLLSVMVIVLILVRVRTKRAQYDANACEAYRAL